ncbi:AtpZ/AtpI family protein [Marinobacter sediminum]|uniref:AtpZ/AtpI family protein n=1 Tax=Marinobacter sediminum TaxID=256323 RepID=UPI00202FCE01|nr:AtpZ/AtpI family protein [Marinobacter sediminum]MCM0612446.1 AtpZ/AtpI family protein [Marinobacter sediminum]
MAEHPHRPGPDGQPPDLGKQVGHRARRKQKAREKGRHAAWFGLGMFGLVGWSVAIPTLIGIAVGLWMDDRWPGKVSWTLTLLIIGIALGCFNAWYWIKQESERD